MTDDAKRKRRSRETPVAGTPQASPPISAEVAAPAVAADTGAVEIATRPAGAEVATAQGLAASFPVDASVSPAAGVEAVATSVAPAGAEPVATSVAPAGAEPVATSVAPAGAEPVAVADVEPVAASGEADVAAAGAKPVAAAGAVPVAAADAEPVVAAGAEPGVAAGAKPGVAAGAKPGVAAGAEPEIERRVGERRSGDRRAGFDPAAVAIPDDGWPLEGADSQAPLAVEVAPPPAPPPPMPSPAAAAYEAARIVGEMVGDIESAPGAALMAAAAAGAAIEVARARVAAGEPDLPPPAATATEGASGDRAITTRMQRERILRALAEDIAATATSTAAAEVAGAAAPAPGDRPSTQPGQPGARLETGRAAPRPGRAASQPPRDDLAADDAIDEGIDPVALAAAAIARLRERARSDLAELRVQYHRLDIVVLLIAFVFIVVTGRIHDRLVTPPTVPFEPAGEHGLSFAQPKGWLVAPGEPLPAPRIAHEVAPSPVKPASAPYRVELTSTAQPTARIEVLIDKKPGWSNIVTGLDLDRRTRWGELYTLDDSSVRSVEDHQWLRTAYRFAHVVERGDVPRIDRALEYATIDREQIYVITFFGSAAEIEQLEEVVAPTLRVATQTGLPLVPQTGHLSTRKYPNAVSRAFDATVMVVVADVVDGRLRARGGGSGVIVGKDGSILTNYHVIHDRSGRLHDVFVIGRFSDQDKAPQLHCAGKPSRSKLQRELDLALIKCDLDLDGRSWSPTSAGASWPTLPQAHTADIKIGQRIWVLGYPDVGGGGLTLSEGEVEGWSGVDGAAGRDFLKTDAAIRHGNSGGPVVGDDGRLVGIASAVRTKQNAAGEVVEVVQAGGRVRPIAAASDLLAIATAGWSPREGQTDVELQPSAIEVPAEGVQIQSRVLDVANEAPVRDALVMVLRPGVNASTVDVNRLDDQVLSYGRSNTQGEVVLKQPVPVPGTYTLMVVARGYEPMIGEGELTLEANTPAVFDPWGKLLLHAR